MNIYDALHISCFSGTVLGCGVILGFFFLHTRTDADFVVGIIEW